MAITLKIDNKEIKAKTGMSVLEAARQADIYIPTLCHHPQLNPSGSCRLCIVEIKGVRGYPTACTIPAEEGMVVQTNTQRLRSLRCQILELILSEHPYTCLVCDKREGCDEWMGTIRKVGITTSCQTCPKSGACELQNLVQYLGIEEIAFPINYRGYPVEQKDPFFDRDYNLCILCGRCVRVCNEVRYNGTLNFHYRGDRTVVGTAFGKSHLEVGCAFCGACVDVCPTGALAGKADKWEGCSEQTQHSICPYCAVGCSLDYHLRGNRIIKSVPAQGKSPNQGQVCVRGRFAVADLVNHPTRLKKPLVKRNKQWIETSWEEALDRIAEQFVRYRGDGFGLVVSPNNTVEDAYVLQKFGRVAMQSRHLAVSSPFAHSRWVDSLVEIEKIHPPHTVTLGDIDQASLILVWGGDLSVSHPIAALRVKQAVHRGAKLIVIDPRKTKLAELADMHLQPNPVDDSLLLSGLMKLIFENRSDPSLSGPQSPEWNDLTNKLKKVNLSLIEEKTGIPRNQMEELVDLLFHHQRILILVGSGLALQASASNGLFGLFNLSVVLKHAKMVPIVGESNLAGCLEMGCMSGLLPGLISVNEESARKKFEKSWGLSIQGERSYDFTELVQQIEGGKIKTLYVTGEIPPTDILKKCHYIVVQSVFRPEWADWADVLLPAAHPAEIDGTVVNFEKRLQRLRRIHRQTGLSKPDWWICSQIAQKMGFSGFSYKKSSDILNEIHSIVPRYSGLIPSKIKEKGLFLLDFKSNQKKKSCSIFHFDVAIRNHEKPKGYPYTLIIDVGISHFRNASLIEKVSGMERIGSEGKVEIHPKDAERLHVSTGECVQIKSNNGFQFEGPVIVTDRIPQKSLYLLLDKKSPHVLECFKGNIHFVKIKKVADDSDCR